MIFDFFWDVVLDKIQDKFFSAEKILETIIVWGCISACVSHKCIIREKGVVWQEFFNAKIICTTYANIFYPKNMFLTRIFSWNTVSRLP
mgnify:CR=1 FL=1